MDPSVTATGGESTEPRSPELEIEASALMELAQRDADLIPGETPRIGAQHFRDMTSAIMQALAEPPVRRRAALLDVVEWCRSRGWKLIMQKDSRGRLVRALAVKEATAAAMRRAATVGDPAPDLPVMYMERDSESGQSWLVASDELKQCTDALKKLGDAMKPEASSG